MTEPALRHRQGTYQRGEDTRRRVLDAALQVFAARGYDGASTRLLAEAAGVNLPAIQYNFGGKEGLYRAVIERIIAQIEARMAPVSARVAAALARPRVPRRALVALLCELLDAFVALVAHTDNPECRRLFFARAEVENSAALAPLHRCAMREIGGPCAAIVARLLGRSPDDELVKLRMLAVLGQATIFCNKGARLAVGWSEIGEARAGLIRDILRRHVEAIFGAAAAGRRRGGRAGARQGLEPRPAKTRAAKIGRRSAAAARRATGAGQEARP
jgi:AcrR family transcriptional regulator